jgi:endonuclease YncB( thermonuclease family)
MPNVPKVPKHPKIPLWKKGIVIAAGVGLIAGGVNVVKRIVEPTELVIEVVDGDTFRISNKQTIRIYGVDAPELSLCFGKEAKEALVKKIMSKKVLLKSPRTDYWRRVEAYVYLDGEFINEYMARNGFGADHSDGTDQSKQIRDAGNLAQVDKLGIYSEKCSPSVSAKSGCVIKGHIPYNTGEKNFLNPSCWGYAKSLVERFRGEDWFCTEKDAIAAGFTKSPNCK